ncbi:MAG: glycosyltransferase family A protein [Bacteroidota bacterium]|nr:glycosyltransferase family A protein [Bacteroidota bacterium]
MTDSKMSAGLSAENNTTNNTPLPQEVTKYLRKYSIEKWQLETSDTFSAKSPFVHMAVVIPAIMEFENIKSLLLSLASNDPECFSKTIIIFVVNNTRSASDEIKTNNLHTLEFLREIIFNASATKDGKPCFNDNAALTDIQKEIISSGLQIGLIDASSNQLELPEKDGGVGLARKLGMDMALRIFDYNFSGKKILVCLDADCTVSRNYLSEIYSAFQKRKLQAAAVNFSHAIDNIEGEHAEAIICYEIFLRYYVLGLTYAHSHYGFHTIGSTMACDHESYIKVEGMNKRKAAEDFYFMEKLAKVVPISKINSTFVYPSPRGSWRVPFGTGQRVNRHLSHVQNEYLLYSPKSFHTLKLWLSAYNLPEAQSAKFYLEEAKKINSALYDFLIHQNFERDYSRIIQNAKKPEQLLRQKSSWFDGFRTLKLIHYLRDHSFADEPMFDALGEIFSLCGIKFQSGSKGIIPPLEIQKKYLKEMLNV